MQGDEGEVIVDKDNPACFSRLLADGKTFLIRTPGVVIITTETGNLPNDVERLRNPRLMRKLAEHCQALLNERHGCLRLLQPGIAQQSERPGHLEPIP